MATGFNPSRGRNASLVGGGGFSPHAAGKKVYGAGRPFPNMGKTPNKAGYTARDAQNEARKNAVLRRIGRNQ